MRIVFIGTGDIGLPALRSILGGDDELAGVVTQPDKPVGRKQDLSISAVKRLALVHGVPVYQPAKIRAKAAVEPIRDWSPDLIVVMAYGQILPRELLHLPRRACLNLHASLLPRHRGAAPIQAAILAGDRESGITVMHVDEGLDTGDIFLKNAIPIRRRETGGSLHDRLAALAPSALCEALTAVKRGEILRTAQESSAATYAPKLEREHGLIDWQEDAAMLERKVRAFNPWPSAHATVHDRGGAARQLKVHTAILFRRRSGTPGEVLRADRDGLLVAAGTGALLLREVQLEGKRRMPAGEFLRGNPIAPGTILRT